MKKLTFRYMWPVLALTVLAGCMTTGWIPVGANYVDTGYQKAGTVTVEMDVWNIFFAKTPDQRRHELLSAAGEQAKSEFGDDAILGAVTLESAWNPISLLLVLDMAGFVETGTLMADVLLPIPPPPPASKPEVEPEPEPKRVVEILYPILPYERYEDTYGYIALAYATKPEVMERTKSRLDKRGAEPEEYENAYARIQEGGAIEIHIGRQDLMHANTLWYSYKVTRGDTILKRKTGQEGIPNIKGRDGNWWNVVTIPLDEPVSGTIDIEVIDTKIKNTYQFAISRVEKEL